MYFWKSHSHSLTYVKISDQILTHFLRGPAQIYETSAKRKFSLEKLKFNFILNAQTVIPTLRYKNTICFVMDELEFLLKKIVRFKFFDWGQKDTFFFSGPQGLTPLPAEPYPRKVLGLSPATPSPRKIFHAQPPCSLFPSSVLRPRPGEAASSQGVAPQGAEPCRDTPQSSLQKS